MKSSQYWENRQAQRMFEYMELSEEAAKEISKYYRNSSIYINSKLDEIFTRYQSKFDLSEKEALDLLNTLDDPTSIDELIKKLKSNLTTEERKNLLAMLEAPAYRVRLNRMQELQKEIDSMMENVYKQEKEISTKNYINVAKESYNKSMFDLQQQTFSFPFSSLNSNDFNRILSSKWSGANFSDRIWANTSELAITLKEELIVSLMTGRKESDVAEIITRRFAVGNNQARRLVRTESCFVAGEMQAQAYDEADIEEYRFVATLDLDTSKQCRELDGKVFKLSKREIGKNYPPMHPWCRSTTICNIDEETLSKIERIASDPVTGEAYKVPANMTYEEWYEKYVSSNPRAIAEEKKHKNRSADRKQYRQYKTILGKENMPDSFEDFQELKYNNGDKWKLLKDYKKSRSSNMISAFTSFDQYVEYKNRIDNEVVGLVTSDGLVVKSQSKHFIERVFGTNEDPKTKKPRDGVELEDIKSALVHGSMSIDKKDETVLRYSSNKCRVTLNKNTLKLIQVNPVSRKKV